MKIEKAVREDLPEIYKLQKEAYLSEAKIHNNYEIQPLTQTLEEIEKEFDRGIVLKALNEEGIITGSVRAYCEAGTVYIGKLMVSPSVQNKGIGRKLLLAVEQYFPGMRYELFTSTKSAKNISLYTKNGYKEFKTVIMPDGVDFIYLEKITGVQHDNKENSAENS